MNRRNFVQRTLGFLAAIAVSGGTLVLTACGNVAQDIITAFQSIVTILNAAGVIPGGPIVSIVLASLQAVLDELTAYQNAPAADKTTVGMKLALLIQIAEAKLQAFWNGLNLTGSLATAVEELVSLILSTLAGFLPVLPVPPTEAPELTAALMLPKRVRFTPKKRSSREFRDEFNKINAKYGYKKVNF